MIELVSITDQKAVTSSLIVADAFGKLHKNVLRDISNLECSPEFTGLNFEPSSYLDPTGRALPMYNLTRDGFTILAMGFTGKEAMQWKEKFIAAFNAMEQALLEGTGERRQVDVTLNHVRGITNPNGLDIKYTLDLTKIAMRPTPAGLAMIERLTGVDMSDIELTKASVSSAPACELSDFLLTLKGWPGKALLKDVHSEFCKWYRATQDTHMPPPSSKWLANELRQSPDFVVFARGGMVYVSVTPK